MFVLRHCRRNIFRDNFYRTSRYSVTFGVTPRQLSEPWSLFNVNTRFDNFKSYTYANFSSFQCWNCQTTVNATPCLFCKDCSLIQSPEKQNFNYFELFDISDQYDIDIEQLTSNFRKLQNLMHPDKFTNKTEEEKIRSESFSSLINKAYSTLVNPLLRGLYMLQICGLNIEEDSTTMDSSFLGEIMDWNEQIEEVNTKESLENLKNHIDIILVNLYKELSEAFRNNNLNQAKLLLSKAKYYSTLIEKIKDIDVPIRK